MERIYDKIRNLVKYLNECTKAYDEGHPVIGDKEWDDKYFELQDLENKTGLILSNSPTQYIEYEVVNSLNKKEHNHKMLSLDKTKSVDDVVAFLHNKSSLAMCKIDGLTCSLTYLNGDLVSAETRGNGLVGEDILHNAKTLPSIPKHIPVDGELVIDGEIICTYDNFKQFENEYKNPRNFAAGSIRLLDAGECARRNLTFVAWDVITPMYLDDNNEYDLGQKLSLISPFGFTVVPYIYMKEPSEKDCGEAVEKIKEIATERHYPIDGVVFKFSNCAYGRSLGETTHHFKNALAYKFYDETYDTFLKDIEWSAGRTGVLSPGAIFEPIEMDGSVVGRATLHNLSIMKEIFGERGPFIGQRISVYKANMITPQIYEAYDTNEEETFYENKEFLEVPVYCPICDCFTSERISDSSVFLMCENPSCAGKLINRLDYFCGKKGLDIKGLSKATLEKLVDWDWVNSFIDLFKLSEHRDEWIKKPGFGVKSVDKILDAIEDRRNNCELHRYICALGIPLVGSTISKLIVKDFNTWDEFFVATKYFNFATIPGIGYEIENNLTNFQGYEEADILAREFLRFSAPATAQASLSREDLAGRTFVITGKLINFKNRDALKVEIESRGGKVAGSISKNTSYLINNDTTSTSSKNKSAQALGIPIISEQEFIEKFS